MFSTLVLTLSCGPPLRLTQVGRFAEEVEKRALSNAAFGPVWVKVCRPLDRDAMW